MLANTRLLMSCSNKVPAQQGCPADRASDRPPVPNESSGWAAGQAHLNCPAVGCIIERQSCSLLLMLLLQVHAGQAHEQEGKALPHSLAVLVQVCKVAPLLHGKVAALRCLQTAA